MNEKTIGKLKDVTEEADPKDVAKEQAEAIAKMEEDATFKAINAKERLVSQLDVMSQKYRTANGVMSALDTERDVLGQVKAGENMYSEIQMAQRIAKSMSIAAAKMKNLAAGTDPEKMDTICEKMYKADMTADAVGPEELAKQLMILQLCQNVGPVAQDIVDFCATTDEEIDKARESLKEYCKANDIDFNSLMEA